MWERKGGKDEEKMNWRRWEKKREERRVHVLQFVLLATTAAGLSQVCRRRQPPNLHICISSSQFSLLAALALHLWSHSLVHPHHLLYE